MRTGSSICRVPSLWIGAAGLLLLSTSTAFLLLPRHPVLLQPSLRPLFPNSFTITNTRLRRPLFLNFDSNDPFQILGMDEPTSDKKVIKRAYKRMALQYHPDVATTKDSSPEDKKLASDRFAKINWAYEVLSGKRENDSTYSTTKSSSSSTSNNARTSGWTPPHRRSGSYSSSTATESSDKTTTGGVDWTDFMPKVDEEEYNAGGDSFSKIFSDLLVGAAAGAAGLGGPNVFRDFIEFLEGNVDGFGGAGGADDADLRILLQTGLLEDVRNELDDTELVVQQLKSKLSDIQNEIVTLNTKVRTTTRYMEKIEMEESLAELNARKEVVEGYVKRAQKRLLSLQTRYKELLTSGGRESYTRQPTSSWDEIKKDVDTSARSSRSTSSSSKSMYTSTSVADPSSETQRSPTNDDDAWMNESFGSSSYGRGRADGRRRSRGSRSTTNTNSSNRATAPSETKTTTTTTTTTSQSPQSDTTRTQGKSYSSSPPATGSSRDTTSTAVNTSAIRTASDTVPPHRRTSGFYENQQEKDKRRLRELKVDDEFEKLKKELGL